MKAGLLVLAALALVGADDPRTLVIEVDAGDHERRDTPIALRLPDDLKQVYYFTLDSIDDGKPVAGQLGPGSVPSEVIWRLEKPLAAGARRRYRLKQAPAPTVPTENRTGFLIGRTIAFGPAGSGLEFRGADDRLVLDLDRRPVLTYHKAVLVPPAGIDPVYGRSGFIHPLSTRSGLVLTDDFSPEHPHQHGVFFAWVNTVHDGRRVDFWNQKARTGNVWHDPDPSKRGGFHGGPVRAEFSAALHHDDLTAPGGPERVLEETWDVSTWNIPGFVVVDLVSTQTCVSPRPLTVDTYHYGGLGFRGSRQWSDPTAKGDDPPDPARSGRSEFLTDQGRHRADGNHTRPRWVDFSGEVDGKVGGVTIVDHPGNFRYPQPVRIHPNMPYFCFAPCVLGPFEIAPGRPYISRYRLIAHDGPPDPEAIERLRADYEEPPAVRVVEGGR